jgi:hypothetical protein
VGRAGDPNFTERLQVATIEPSLVQIVNARTMLGIALTFQMSRGFHSSPYRFVRTADGRFSLPEAHPDQRLRASCTGRMLRYLARWLGVELSYRFYGDAWGVLSHTGMLSLRSSFRDAWDVTLRGRGYYQSAAWFWREQYIEPLAYMSADRELSTFYDLGGGMKVAWRRWGWTFDGKADVTFYRFIDFRPLPRRLAIVAGLGAGYEW